MNSYFLPGQRIRRKLARAARNGVEIRVILSKESDVEVVQRAQHYLYQWMFRNNSLEKLKQNKYRFC